MEAVCLTIPTDGSSNADTVCLHLGMTFSAYPDPDLSRQDLADFIDQFRDSLRQDPESWENNDLESFLEALSAWTREMDGYFTNRGEPVPDVPSWRLIAQMLLAARVYE
ncbi:DUF7660 family protein [Paenarthrobacter sp. YAF11_1]|uniref:DUF7660 family protein n=1 Tax=Paenarthrobacter sp. YAF11_1 TaxID=3233074 RepID=UPI003F97F9DE